jgi:hypothetical protein
MKIFIATFLCVLGFHAQAQLAPAPSPPVKGKLFISVDDKAVILVNGTEVHKGDLGESESSDIEIKPGDRIVVNLKNTLDKRRFMMLFMSNDRQQMVNFTSRFFKILPDPLAKDFTPTEFASIRQQAKDVRMGDYTKGYPLPFKSTSEWIWGDVNVCSIGCILTKEMFKQNPRR